MRTANQLTFTIYEASLKIKPNDPIKVIFDNIDWSFIHDLARNKYSRLPQGAEGFGKLIYAVVKVLKSSKWGVKMKNRFNS